MTVEEELIELLKPHPVARVARKTGLTRQTIYAFLNGEMSGKTKTIIATYLGLEIQETLK